MDFYRFRNASHGQPERQERVGLGIVLAEGYVRRVHFRFMPIVVEPKTLCFESDITACLSRRVSWW